MAEKREIEHIAGIKPDDGREYIHTNIGFNRSADKKYEVYFPVPVTGIIEALVELSKECQDLYGCDLVQGLRDFVRQISTRVDYKVGFYQIGEMGSDGEKITNDLGTDKKPESSHPDWGQIKPAGHEAMQAMADNYKIGARVAGEGIKSKATKLDTMVSKYAGGSLEELEAKMAKLAELEAQGLL